jgi:hypothetical protein
LHLLLLLSLSWPVSIRPRARCWQPVQRHLHQQQQLGAALLVHRVQPRQQHQQACHLLEQYLCLLLVLLGRQQAAKQQVAALA